MRKLEIDRKFDEIVAFSELESFSKPPSNTTHPECTCDSLLPSLPSRTGNSLVDEVLAVGDAAFQKKCLGKMGEVAKQGRTVLFVSHNLTAVKSLCRRTFWLDKGEIVDNDSAEKAGVSTTSKAARRRRCDATGTTHSLHPEELRFVCNRFQ